MAYLVSSYGHQGGVFQNMLIQEVEVASKSSDGKNYVVSVSIFSLSLHGSLSKLSSNAQAAYCCFFCRSPHTRSGIRGCLTLLDGGGIQVVPEILGVEVWEAPRCPTALQSLLLPTVQPRPSTPVSSSSHGSD